MRQRKWFIAIATALFVLQAPLCGVACLPNADAAPVDAAGHGESPCHQEAPTSTPSTPADSHDDCGCEDSYAAVVASAERTSASVALDAVLLPNAFVEELNASLSWVPRTHLKETDLPPPDILLLKSTLLI